MDRSRYYQDEPSTWVTTKRNSDHTLMKTFEHVKDHYEYLEEDDDDKEHG